MALSFDVCFSSTYEGASGGTVNTTVYAEDLNLCSTCVEIVGGCWACLQYYQKVFSNSELTNDVNDGYYGFTYPDMSVGIWRIKDSQPEIAGYNNG